MNKINFQVISNIFCDVLLERDRPTDRQTDRQRDRASYRCAMAHLKNALFNLFSIVFSLNQETENMWEFLQGMLMQASMSKSSAM